MERKWLPSFGELIDRLSIHQLKEVFIPEHKQKYAKDMKDIIFDLDQIIKEDKIIWSGEAIRCIVVISQINTHIWYNESKARKGEAQDSSLLMLTHGLNGLRNKAINHLLGLLGQIDKQDWKIDCLASEFKDWEISLGVIDEDIKKSNNEKEAK